MKVQEVYVSDDGKMFEKKEHALKRDEIKKAELLAYEAQQEAERLTELHEDMVEECNHPIVEIRRLGEIFVTCQICDEVATCTNNEQLKRNFGKSKQVLIK